MKIQNKIIISFVILFLITMGVAQLTCDIHMKDIIINEVNNHFQTAAQSRAHHITTFLNSEATELKNWATGYPFIDYLIAYNNGNVSKDQFEKLNNRIHSLNRGIGVFSKEGIMLVAENTPIGADYSSFPYFSTDMDTIYTTFYFEENTQKYMLGMMVSIRDPNTQEVIGVIGKNVDMSILNEITTDNTGLGKTGEIFLIDSNKILLTPTKKLNDEAIMNLVINTENTKACFEDIIANSETPNQNGSVPLISFKDYTGVEVIGTHRYIPNFQMCLIAKMDAQEAYAPLDILTLNFITISLILIVVSTISIIFISKTITKPIENLTAKIKQIQKGNFSKPISTVSNDEIGKLSKTFEEMRLGIKNRNDLLNAILNSLKGKFGKLTMILIRKEIEKASRVNPNILKVLPKNLKKNFKKK